MVADSSAFTLNNLKVGAQIIAIMSRLYLSSEFELG